MRIFTTGLILLAVASTAACASETVDGDGVDADAGTGGGTATGGTASGTGGTASGTGGVASGTGGAAAAVDCVLGTVVATAPPTVLAWELQAGGAAEATIDEVLTAAGPATITTEDGEAHDAYIAAVLSTWAATGRQCVDVSAFTGVRFDLTATTSDVILKVGVSEADPAGSCTSETGCYAHPSFTLASTSGTAIEVPFASLTPATWGVMAPFNNKEVVSLIWATTDITAGKTITVSNVTFY